VVWRIPHLVEVGICTRFCDVLLCDGVELRAVVGRGVGLGICDIEAYFGGRSWVTQRSDREGDELGLGLASRSGSQRISNNLMAEGA